MQAIHSKPSRNVGTLCVLGALGLATLGHAQTGPANSLSSAPPAPVAAAEGEAEQGRATQRTMSLVPRLSLETSWSSNVRQGQGTGEGSDFVASVQPGLRLAANGDRLKGYADYSLRRLFYASNSSLNRSENALRAFGTAELAENFAFIDVSGNISQQAISAFSPQPGNDLGASQNRTETSVYRVSPYVRGLIGDWANYQARYSRTATRSKSSLVASDHDADDLSLQVSSASQLRGLGWMLDLNRQEVDYDNGRSFESDRARLYLNHAVSPQLTLSVFPGWESNNYLSTDKDSNATLGGRVQWAPSERTSLSALLEKRFFGRAYSLSAEHRTPRTAWRYSNSRDASATPNQNVTTSLGPLYDLLFFQFASIEPDPVARAQLVQAYLIANGLDGSTSVDLGFLVSSVSLARRQDLGLTLIGRRDTLSFLLAQSETSRLTQTTLSGDLGSSAFVRQHGFSISYSRRLTPQASLNVLASQSRSAGDNSAALHSNSRSLNLSLSSRLGEHVTGTLAVRRTLSDSSLTSYSESSVRAGVSMQF